MNRFVNRARAHRSGLSGTKALHSVAPMTTRDDPARNIFKVMPRADYESAVNSGVYSGSAVDLSDGFIHFSTGGQLAETLRRHYAGQHDLVILAVPAAALGGELRWEPSRGGDLFPHLYAPLPIDLVASVQRIDVGPDGATVPPKLT